MENIKMADKLDWLNQHFVLLLHKTVAEVIANENYKLRKWSEITF